MNYVINKDILSQYNLTIGEFLYLLLNIETDKSCLLFKDIKNSLIEKRYGDIDVSDENKLVFSNEVRDLISRIIVESDRRVVNSSIDYNDIAAAMRDCYPSGRKSGTNYLWKDSIAVIANKLKTLHVKYDFVFTKEQAVDATKRYVESFEGDYTYMQLLKYFILKTDTNREIRSDFMAYIENADQEDDNSSNWTERLI